MTGRTDMAAKAGRVFCAFALALALVPAGVWSAPTAALAADGTSGAEEVLPTPQVEDASGAEEVLLMPQTEELAPAFAELNPDESKPTDDPTRVPDYYEVAAKADRPGQEFTLYYYTVNGTDFYRVYGSVDGQDVGYYAYDELSGTVDSSKKLNQVEEKAVTDAEAERLAPPTTPEVAPEVTPEVTPDGGPAAANGGLEVRAVRNLSFVVKSLAGNALTPSQLSNFVMADSENLIVEGTYTAAQGTITSESASISLPKYYVFDNATNGANYTITDVKPGSLKIIFPAPSTPGVSSTIGFSFKVKLDRTSISSDERAQWQKSTWSPNDSLPSFTMTMDDASGDKVANDITIATAAYTGATARMRISTVDAHGNAFAGDQNWLEGDYAVSDLYRHGPVDMSAVVLTLPEGFCFAEGAKSDWGTVTVSADKRTATVAVADHEFTDKRSFRFYIGAAPTYINIDNTQVDNRFAPGTTFVLKTQYQFLDSFIPNKDVDFTLKVSNYQLGETGAVKPVGTPDLDDGNKVVLQQVASGAINKKTSSVATVSRAESEALAPLDKGVGYSYEVNFDDAIKVKSFRVPPSASYSTMGQLVDPYKVDTLIYYTNKNAGGTVVAGATIGQGDVALTLAPDEYVTSIKISYSYLAYPRTHFIALDYVGYDAPTGTPGEKFEIKHALKNAAGVVVNSGSNYIMIEKEKCPSRTFTYTDESGKKYTQPGVYSVDGEAGYFAASLNNKEVGGSSGIKSTIENPRFIFGYNRNNGAALADQRTSLFWSGRFWLNAALGSGGWTLTVQTTTAQAVYDASPGNATAVTRTFTMPKFTEGTEINLYDATQFGSDALLPDDVILGGVVLAGKGTFDLSSLSGASTEKTYVKVYVRQLSKHPLQGTSLAAAAGNNILTTNLALRLIFDDCTDIDHAHREDNPMGAMSPIDYAAGQKGSDILRAKKMTTDYVGSLKQGQQTTITANVSLTADESINAQLWTQGGETAYFKLANQGYVSIVPGTAKFDGTLDPTSAVVTIGGEKYLKVINRNTTPVQKSKVSGETFEPYVISFDVYALPTTPTTTALSIFESNSWLDLAASQTSSYEVGGVTCRTSLQPRTFHIAGALQWVKGGVGAYGGTLAVDAVSDADKSNPDVVIWDDPLGLHAGTDFADRNWALSIKPWTTVPELDAVQGISLNPGISNAYVNETQEVRPSEESSMTSAVSIIAGTTDMQKLTSTIKIPRAGDVLANYTKPDGGSFTTTVSQYLTGPLVQVTSPKDPSSTPVIVTYSVDGVVFLTADQVTGGVAWKDISYVKIENQFLKSNDTALLYLPLITEKAAAGEKAGSEGESYWEAVFTTSNLAAKSNRMNTYHYEANTISGIVWEDTSKDGMIDVGEPHVAGITAKLYQDYSGAKTLLDTTTSDANGFYSFETKYYADLTVETTLPFGMKSTIYSATTDNAFEQGKLDVTTNQKGLPAVLSEDVTSLDLGVFTAMLLGYDGNGADSGVAPVSPSEYAQGQQVTVLGNTGASVAPGDPYQKSGYSFTGWNTAADGSGTTYQAGNTFAIAVPTMLYAQWSEDNIALTYKTDGSTGCLVDPASENVLAATGAATGSTATPGPGYRFINWTSADGTEVSKDAHFVPAKVGGLNVAATFTANFAEDADVIITYASADTAKGTVAPGSETLSPATGTATGSTAVAKPGYHFVNWTNNLNDTKTTDAALTKDQVDAVAKTSGIYVAATFTANFVEDADITITYASADTAKGTVDPTSEMLAPATGTATGSTATAKSGYHFVNWTSADGTIVSTDVNFIPATVDGLNVAVTYTANFAEDGKVTIVYASDGTPGCSVSPTLNDLSPATGTATGSTATPAAGYHFVNWTNSLNDTKTTDAVLTKDQVDAVAKTSGIYVAATFTANFAENDKVTISYASADMATGTVDPASEALAPATGAAAGSTAVAKPGYHFVNWTNNLNDTKTTDAALTAAQVDAVAKTSGIYVAATFTANFVEDADITITYASADTAKGTVDPTSEMLAPATGTATGSTATAKPGYHFVNWTSADGTIVSTDVNFIPAAVDGLNVAVTYTANFAEDADVTISYVSADAIMGTVAPGSETLAPATGTAVGSTATPVLGYHFVNWTDATNSEVSKDAHFVPATVDGLNVAATFTANFAADPDTTIEVTKSVSSATAAPGDTLTYTIRVANTGNHKSNGIFVKDYLPANTTFVSCDDRGIYSTTSSNKNYVKWWIEEGLMPGETIDLKFVVRVNQCQDGTEILNVALWQNTLVKPDGSEAEGQGADTNQVKTVVGGSNRPALMKTGDTLAGGMGIMLLLSVLGGAGMMYARRRTR